MPNQRQSFFNGTSGPLEVMVEPTPDRHVLQPLAEMVLEFGHDVQDQIGVHVYDEWLQIRPGIWPLNVCINGEKAAPDWTSPGPNAAK